jgi:hypothetical protein
MRRIRLAAATVIAAAVVVTVIAVPAASAGVRKYDTEVTITKDRGFLYHGVVNSEVRKCVRGRRVILLKKRPGEDRKVGHARSNRKGFWGFISERSGGRFYAKVTREVKDGDVCLADRSPIQGGAGT